MSDSNDWLASIDLNAVKPAKGQRKKKGKPHKRIVYGEPSRLAPAIPFWARGTGPDLQRQVREVAGKFVPTEEICNIQATYDEALELLALVTEADSSSRPRLLAILRTAIASHEMAEANRIAAVAAAAEDKELFQSISELVDLIPVEE